MRIGSIWLVRSFCFNVTRIVESKDSDSWQPLWYGSDGDCRRDDVLLAEGPVLWLIIGAMILGALVGMWKAKTVAMTQMPETVALMHSFVGLAAVAIALATVLHTEQEHGAVARVELFIGCFIGAITFSASVFAFGKLAAKSWAKTVTGGWVKPVQALLFIAMIGFGGVYFVTDSLACVLCDDSDCSDFWLDVDCAYRRR
ncbi:hypothetical protein PKHYL_31500 [Psychrobacter sp. KH172YL61]|nr:hypothetical protein PKHYL_31500 [Psychrobacter sp. KH172YL61]